MHFATRYPPPPVQMPHVWDFGWIRPNAPQDFPRRWWRNRQKLFSTTNEIAYWNGTPPQDLGLSGAAPHLIPNHHPQHGGGSGWIS